MSTLEIDVSALPEQHRAWVTDVMKQAEGFLRKGEELAPVAMVRSSAQDSMAVVSARFDSEEDKNAFASHVRLVCHATQADALLLVGESWALPASKVDDHKAIRAKYGSIGECPDRIDSAIFTLETASLTYACLVQIEACPPSKKKRRFKGPAKFLTVTGRFSQFLSTTESKQSKH